MSTPPASQANSENKPAYTLEILAELTGLSTQTILHYQEHGFIQIREEAEPRYTDETVRVLRRVEHLRECYAPNLAGLKLLTHLMNEVELLRAELHARR